MVLIKCFSESHTENMAACLQLRPETMLLIGNERAMAEPIRNYRSILKKRGQRTDIQVCDSWQKDLVDLSVIVKRFITRQEEYVIDLTGGEEVIVMALGAVVAGMEPEHRAKIRMIRYDFTRNVLLDCIHDYAPMAGKPLTLPVEDLIALHGGTVHPSSHQPGKEVTVRQLDPLWELASEDPKWWNQVLMYLGELESWADDKTQVFLSLRFMRGEIKDFERKEEMVRELLEEFHNRGIIKNHSSRDCLEYTYTSSLYRYCTLKAGNVLEMKTLLEARALLDKGVPFFQDCKMSVHIDWDGIVHDPEKRIPETRNEIDVLLTRGMTPLFISCKNGNVGEDELYKLNTVVANFGGPHARKMLVATEYLASPALRQRAWDMDILLVDKVADYSKEQWRDLFRDAMA